MVRAHRTTVGSGSAPTRVALGLVVGFVVGMLGGVALAIVPARALLVVPLLLMGLAVGEVVRTAWHGEAGPVPCALAFVCATVGPLVGLALARGVLTQLTARIGIVGGGAGAVGPLDLLLVGAAGLLAAWRAGSGGAAGSKVA